MSSVTGTDGLTARQLEVLAFLYGHARDKGFQPDYREMAEEFGFTSPNGAVGHVEALERKGYLRTSRGARNIEILKRPDGRKFEGFADKE